MKLAPALIALALAPPANSPPLEILLQELFKQSTTYGYHCATSGRSLPECLELMQEGLAGESLTQRKGPAK